ncbi:hypothetical protein VTI74DRAFT_673 [Chaetomium olivicolor]
MGRLGPLMSQGLGRSPYDDVVMGTGPEDPRGPRQLYDERGRPINPETKRINRGVIRSHNEVMMVIGVAEPEHDGIDPQAEAALKHHRYEDRIGRRLLLAGSIVETATIWGVNGMRQRILLYKPYSQTTFYGMFELVRSQQSLTSYFFNGLPTFLASTLLEQLAPIEFKRRPWIQYATTYMRLHLAIYTFFQRTGIISSRIPHWKFFIPGTSKSPISLPPFPSSFRPGSLLGWLSAAAISLAPFAGFYIYTNFYSFITRFLRYNIHRLLPRPYNATKRRSLREPSYVPIEVRTDEIIEPLPSTAPAAATDPSPGAGAPLRRQSTASLRPTNPNAQSGPGPENPAFDSDDDEDPELISGTLISFDVASDPAPEGPHPAGTTTTPTGAGGGNANEPGVWSAELLMPGNMPDGSGGSGGRPFGASASGQEPVYRESVLTRLPAILATEVLAITPARLLMTPVASAIWLQLARPYMERMGMALDGVVDGVGIWWGLWSPRALVNLLGLEVLLAVVHGEAWAGLVMVAERYMMSEEEWFERTGAGKKEEEEEGEGS